MPATPLPPGGYVEEADRSVRSITGVATSIALFIGWAPRGPVDAATRVASFADYQESHGGLDRRTPLGHAVKHFFDNGGSDARVVRLVGPGAAAGRATLGNLAIEANSPGAWSDGYAVRTTPQAADAQRFTLDVIDKNSGSAVVESFQDLCMDAGDPRYVSSAINGRSEFIRVETSGTSAPGADASDLAGGANGAVLAPGTADFHSSLAEATSVGSIIDRIDLFNLVCVPGETDPAALAGLQALCRRRRAFLIADADPNATVASLRAGLPAALTGSDAGNSALFFPWVRAPDPLQQDALTAFPPSGFVAGVFARIDAARGVWKPPAGTDASLEGAAGLAVTLSDAENAQLNALAISCLRTLPAYGNVVWGSRTLQGQNDRGSEWKYIPVRRMALFLEESLYRGTRWAAFEPNGEPLWAQIRLNVGAFLHGLFRQGAFQGQTPTQAYFVRCDGETTTQADIDAGMVNILVGFAPVRPAEFVVIKLRQVAGGIPA